MTLRYRSFFLMILFASLAQGASAEKFRVLQLNIWQEGTSVPDGLEKIADVIVKSEADIVAFSEVRNYGRKDWHGKILAALIKETRSSTDSSPAVTSG